MPAGKSHIRITLEDAAIHLWRRAPYWRLSIVMAAFFTIVAIAHLFYLASNSYSGPELTLKIRELHAARTLDGLVLTIEGDILNTGSTPRDVPRLRVALYNLTTAGELQSKIVDPPVVRLASGAVAHFRTSFERPDNRVDHAWVEMIGVWAYEVWLPKRQ